MTDLSRRTFVKTVGLGLAALPATVSAAEFSAPRASKTKLGIDNFSVRAFGWNAEELIDYAASLKTDSLFITDLKPFSSRSDDYLNGVRARAADKGLQIQLGSWSICPTSRAFKSDWGTAEEHLTLGIRMAKALGSPVFRVILGTGEDRKTPGGIEARIEDTIKVLKSCSSKAVDAGVKVAVENHAGDMQAFELASLVERAGKDYVGVNLDSGNAAWTLEDPLESLEILGPYAVTTSLRDSAIWESADGAKVQWTAMGDGIIDWKKYFARFVELCPNVPVHIETISGGAREFPYLKKEFWTTFPNARGKDFARFVALAKKGKPIEPFKIPAGQDRKQAEKDYQKSEIERSIKYCKEALGLGMRA